MQKMPLALFDIPLRKKEKLLGLRFEWNAVKAAENLAKHKVSFEEAAGIFGDPLSVTLKDEGHSIREQRFVTIGLSGVGRHLVVVHTDRGERIRIISARIATKRERKQYEEIGD
jgi:uncharacterized protein